MNCPKCGSPTFTANIDDRETVLCMNDDCKWKAVICTFPFSLTYQEFERRKIKAKEKNGCVAETCSGCKHISVWKGCDWDGKD